MHQINGEVLYTDQPCIANSFPTVTQILKWVNVNDLDEVCSFDLIFFGENHI